MQPTGSVVSFQSRMGCMGLAVDNLVVFYPCVWERVDGIDDVLAGLVDGMVFGPAKAFGQRAVDYGSHCALLFAETNIAAAHGEPVGFADYRAGNYLDVGHALDFGHTAYDCYLLEVLFSEVCPGGSYIVEEAADNLGNAVEVSRAHGSLHDFGHRAEVEYAFILFGVDFGYFRGEHHIDTFGFKHDAVGIESARIGGEILWVVELCGVDEYADHYHVVFAPCAVNERTMAGVECTHRGYKADGATWRVRASRRLRSPLTVLMISIVAILLLKQQIWHE